jgi:His/Glu/Gln/Arg/opine family amino acid ABC transporter permease subunit
LERVVTIDWNIVQTAIPLLARGTVVTLQISLVAGVLACIIGFMLGLAALSNVRALRATIAAYVDFVRGTPLLIQVFLVFFVAGHRHPFR